MRVLHRLSLLDCTYLGSGFNWMHPRIRMGMGTLPCAAHASVHACRAALVHTHIYPHPPMAIHPSSSSSSSSSPSISSPSWEPHACMHSVHRMQACRRGPPCACTPSTRPWPAQHNGQSGGVRHALIAERLADAPACLQPNTIGNSSPTWPAYALHSPAQRCLRVRPRTCNALCPLHMAPAF